MSYASVTTKREMAANSITQEPPTCYKTFDELVKRSLALKLNAQWNIDVLPDQSMLVSQRQAQFTISSFEIHVNADLIFTIRVFGWLIPQENILYRKYSRSMENVTLSSLISELEHNFICSGITQADLQTSHAFIHHIVPMQFDYMSSSSTPLCQKVFYRSPGCLIIVIKDGDTCTECCQLLKKETKLLKRKRENLATPAKLNAPIQFTSPMRVKLALKQHRDENKLLKKEIASLKTEIESKSVPVSDQLNTDIQSIMKQASPQSVSPFMKLFWQEQLKYIDTAKKGVRYHPMLIRYCLNLASKSPAAYDDIRFNEEKGTGFLILPSRRRLRDYKNFIRPQRGFNHEIIKELCNRTKNFSEKEKYVAISFDEMRIQQDLVWDKHTGDLIGFVDLGDKELNVATLEGTDALANHVLVLMVRGLTNPFKFSLATFATTGSTCFQMFPLLWKAISILELTCGLKVVAETCDGASSNRKLFKMHKLLEPKEPNKADVTYKVRNLFSREPRNIYFFSDAPHLMKTARNCFANSGAGTGTRFMWNDGHFILWTHLTQMYNEDKECGLQLLPKLKEEHVRLNSYSIMNVRLAAQVLSSSVAKVLFAYGPPEAAGTAKFCSMMDQFFDCTNVRNKREHPLKQKAFLKPYTTTDDIRFDWLINSFLVYFVEWKKSIQERKGSFNDKERASMFISSQTFEGLKITCHSLVECTQYLLCNGVDYVLSERFSQDALENYFGQQRSLGRRKDNPTLKDFGYNDNSIRNQLAVTPIAGNVGGVKYGQIANLNKIDETPVPSRQTKRFKEA